MNKSKLRSLLFYITLLFAIVPRLLIAQCVESDIINLRKIAIVFGEKDYKYATPLTNPINDATDITDSLKKIGFDVLTYQNCDLQTMKTAVDDWCNKLNHYDVALFYFSGHGVGIKDENFLIPVDANPQGMTDLINDSFSANQLVDRLDNSNVKYSVMILDACRSNPFTRNWARDFGNGGLAAIVGKQTFIGYAASPGKTASDGDKRNGIYTEAILKHITIPDLTIDQIFTKVNSYVRLRTEGKQIPFKSSSFSTDYCFSINRSKNNNSKNKTINYVQPCSGILLSPDEKYISVTNSIEGDLVVKDAKTLGVISTLLSKQGKPDKLTSKYGENFFVLDSVNNSLTIIDWIKKTAKNRIQFASPPLSIAVSHDERKAYVDEKTLNKGIIDVVDVSSNSVIKKISIDNIPSTMIVSPDGKYLYVSSRDGQENDNLILLEIKTDKIVKSIRGISLGSAIGISIDNKKLYLSYNDIKKSSYEINCIDLNTFKIVNQIDFKATSFSFTIDGKYLFALGNSEIAIIGIATNEIISKIRVASIPEGIALPDDGTALIWLPQENRIFSIDIAQQLKNKVELDPESKLKEFKEELKKDETAKKFEEKEADKKSKRQIYDQIYNKVIPLLNDALDSLKSELGALYRIERSVPYDDITFGMHGVLAIVNNYDGTKRIIPKCIIQYNNVEVLISLKDDKIDKEPEVLKTSLNKFDNKQLKKFIRNYFSNRIDHLK